MTKENRQFWQAMWIMTKKELIPAVLIAGAITAGITYIVKNKDKIKHDLDEHYEKSVFYKQKTLINTYNPFEKTK